MTAHMRAQGATADAVCEVRDLSSCLPEDLGGLPYRDGEVTRYAPQAWMDRLCAPGAYGVLVLDDLPAASTAVQVASRQISLEHRVHDAVIAPGVMVIVTGNRREDKSAAATLPAHFRNSVLLLTVDADFRGWARWYAEQGLDPLIPRFLTFRTGHFSQLPKDADGQGAFATPRSWTSFARLLPVARATDTVWEVAAGLVGEGVATEFVAFQRVAEELVSAEEVLDDPKGALPDPAAVLGSPDRMIAMVCALADTTIARARGTRDNRHHERYLRALAWVTEKGGREFVAASVSTFVQNRGNFQKLEAAVRTCKDEPEVKGMLGALAACFEGV
jgi:hypothetical protein